jgi:hypothetical protein
MIGKQALRAKPTAQRTDGLIFSLRPFASADGSYRFGLASSGMA